MADTNKITYVSLENLDYYDDKIKAHIQTKDEALNTSLTGLISAEETRAKAAELTNAQAAEAAQQAADKAQGEVDALETYVGTFTASEGVDTVVKYIDAKTANIASDATVNALAERVTQAEKDIDAIEADYLKAADKQDVLDAVNAEKERAMGVEGGLETRLAAVEGDYLVEADKTELNNLITANANAIDAIEADYLKEEDKTELQGNIDAVSAVANAAVKQSDYDVKVKALEDEDARIVGLVEAEKERAEGVEAGLEERLVEVETFFKTTEDETLDEALDTLVELQKYLSDEGAVADQMILDIAANKKAIEDHVATNHDFAAADATLKSELEGKIALKADATTVSDMDTAYKAADEALDARLDVLEAINHDAYIAADATLKSELEGKIALKADQTALDQAVEALEGADADLEERIEALEGQLGDSGSVAQDIATAKQEAIDAAAQDATTKANQALVDAKAYADAEDAKIETRVDALEAASATHALASDLTALAGRVTTAEGEIDTLQTEMDAVEALAAANKAAHEANAAAIALKASQADLEALDARVVVVEEWQANMVECEASDIDALFA